MRDGLIGAYVIVAPDAIPAHSSLSALEDGDVGRIVLVEIMRIKLLFCGSCVEICIFVIFP